MNIAGYVYINEISHLFEAQSKPNLKTTIFLICFI